MAELNFAALRAAAGDLAPERDVPPGTYTAVVDHASSRVNQNGKLQINIKFKVTDAGEAQGGTIWSRQTLSPESETAVSIWFKTFAALGIAPEAWDQFGGDAESAGAAVATQIQGTAARINVQLGKEYNGERRPEVKRITQTSAPAPGAVRTAATAAPAPASVPRPTF